jgi:hypothetical protein
MNIEHCPFNVGIHADEERKENGQYICPFIQEMDKSSSRVTWHTNFKVAKPSVA